MTSFSIIVTALGAYAAKLPGKHVSRPGLYCAAYSLSLAARCSTAMVIVAGGVGRCDSVEERELAVVCRIRAARWRFRWLSIAIARGPLALVKCSRSTY